jgi:hypothetical protein
MNIIKQISTILTAVAITFAIGTGTVHGGNNLNGTITHNGLVWIEYSGCLEPMTWDDATARVKSLAHGQCGLNDRSKAGDWRLPTKEELQALYRNYRQLISVRTDPYWSSSTSGSLAWAVAVHRNIPFVSTKDSHYYFWPVRAEK